MFSIHGVISGHPSRQLWSLRNAFQSFTDAITFAPRVVAGAATGAVAGATGGSAKSGWDEGFKKPQETTSEWFDKASPYVNQYAPMVAGGALTLMGMPYLGAGLMTAMQGYQGYDQTGKVDWNQLGKNAAINYGTAGIADWAKSAGAAAKTSQQGVQAGKNIVASGSAPLTSNAITLGGTTPGIAQTASNLGVGSGTLLNGVPSTMAAFGSAAGAEGAKQMSSVDAARQKTLSQQAPTSIPDQAYNASVAAAPQLGNTALTATLAPKQSTPLSGFDATTSLTGDGDVYDPSGLENFNAFGGDAVGSSDPITQEQYDEMFRNLSKNAGLQINATRDIMLPAGQDLPDPNTPYSDQLMDIGKSYTQSALDLDNYVGSENINRINAKNEKTYTDYNKQLQDSLMQNNPGRVTPDVFSGWLKDRTTIPTNLQEYFIAAPTPLPQYVPKTMAGL